MVLWWKLQCFRCIIKQIKKQVNWYENSSVPFHIELLAAAHSVAMYHVSRILCANVWLFFV